jgi:hypothetical protein
MGLNESSGKLDAQLDSVCKKIERIALDTSSDAKTKLTFKLRSDKGFDEGK